mmetsp:Transcript_18954/g.47352  ORF Transcript_18954/g.47352 Transcript_18954/m.47352 type:complete len:286 (-) Transcript_18954:2244-3101(-)
MQSRFFTCRMASIFCWIRLRSAKISSLRCGTWSAVREWGTSVLLLFVGFTAPAPPAAAPTILFAAETFRGRSAGGLDTNDAICAAAGPLGCGLKVGVDLAPAPLIFDEVGVACFFRTTLAMGAHDFVAEGTFPGAPDAAVALATRGGKALESFGLLLVAAAGAAVGVRLALLASVPAPPSKNGEMRGVFVFPIPIGGAFTGCLLPPAVGTTDDGDAIGLGFSWRKTEPAAPPPPPATRAEAELQCVSLLFTALLPEPAFDDLLVVGLGAAATAVLFTLARLARIR